MKKGNGNGQMMVNDSEGALKGLETRGRNARFSRLRPPPRLPRSRYFGPLEIIIQKLGGYYHYCTLAFNLPKLGVIIIFFCYSVVKKGKKLSVFDQVWNQGAYPPSRTFP